MIMKNILKTLKNNYPCEGQYLKNEMCTETEKPSGRIHPCPVVYDGECLIEGFKPVFTANEQMAISMGYEFMHEVDGCKYWRHPDGGEANFVPFIHPNITTA